MKESGKYGPTEILWNSYFISAIRFFLTEKQDGLEKYT